MQPSVLLHAVLFCITCWRCSSFWVTANSSIFLVNYRHFLRDAFLGEQEPYMQISENMNTWQLFEIATVKGQGLSAIQHQATSCTSLAETFCLHSLLDVYSECKTTAFQRCATYVEKSNIKLAKNHYTFLLYNGIISKLYITRYFNMETNTRKRTSVIPYTLRLHHALFLSCSVQIQIMLLFPTVHIRL